MTSVLRTCTLLVPLLALAACKHQLPSPEPTSTATVSSVLAPVDTVAVDAASDDLWQAIQARMARHGVSATAGASAVQGRSTEARLQLAAASSAADHVVLVEAEPVFVSQVAGRYRWKVEVTLTMAPRDDLERARSWSWKIPVFLRFYHQRDAHALDAAVPVLERNLDRAVAEYLEG